jgi:hypothetical protein
MKTLSFAVFVVALNIATLNAQNAGGSSSGSAPAAGTAPGAFTPVTPNTPQGPATPPNGNESGQQPNAPATINSSSDGSVAVSSNAVGSVSNQFGFLTNQFGSNGFGFATNQGGLGSNQFGLQTNQFGTNLTPTGGATNRILGTNNFGLTNSTSAILRDQAITPTDRQLLTQLRASVLGGNVSAQQAASAPVHFIIANGVVRLVGEVPTMEQRQQVETTVQQVPGVVRIFNALNVAGQPPMTVTTVPGSTAPNPPTPTSEPGRPPAVFPGFQPPAPQAPGQPNSAPGTNNP